MVEILQLVRGAAASCTCLKRIVVCALFDASDTLLAVESNRCAPPDNLCVRLDRRQTVESYDNSGCNADHAEERALLALPPGTKAHKAVIFGHRFSCPNCSRLLREHGVTKIELMELGKR